jgi:hypothetical protein
MSVDRPSFGTDRARAASKKTEKDLERSWKERHVKGKLSTLSMAAVGGIIGALAIGAVVSAGADVSDVGPGGGNKVAEQEVGAIIEIAKPEAEAGGDVGGHGGGLAWGGGGGGGGGGGSVNSSGNSANTNTNAVAVNNQLGVQQSSTVVQTSENVAVAQQEQSQDQAQTQDQTQDQHQWQVDLDLDLDLELIPVEDATT